MICYQGWIQIVVIEKFLLNRQIIVTRVMSSRNVLLILTPKKYFRLIYLTIFERTFFYTYTSQPSWIHSRCFDPDQIGWH